MINFTYKSQIIKSGDVSNGRIPVVIIPNHPTPDRVNDLIVAEAFDYAKEDFLKEGVIDFDHYSVLSKNPLEQAMAIIGQPTDLFVNNDGIPECHAFLFEDNPFVRDAILPSLKTGSTVWGASVGGRALKSEPINSDKFKKQSGKKITRILLKHIAITPLQKAVHNSTSVSLVKSLGENIVDFSDYNSFVKSFLQEDYLKKALEAGAQTDISMITGGQAIQSQSLEGTNSLEGKEILINDIFFDVIMKLYNGEINSKKEIDDYIDSTGLNENLKKVIIDTLAKHKDRIVSVKKSLVNIY